MTHLALRVEECCAWCRGPVTRCVGASCDDAPTYTGCLVRGEWRELAGDPEDRVPETRRRPEVPALWTRGEAANSRRGAVPRFADPPGS